MNPTTSNETQNEKKKNLIFFTKNYNILFNFRDDLNDDRDHLLWSGDVKIKTRINEFMHLNNIIKLFFYYKFFF